MAKDPIKKAENGTYYFRANLGFHPITGKQIQKYKSGFKTKKEAREAYSKLMLTSTEELTEKKQQLSFQQFIEETYLPWYKTQVKESTYLNRRSTIQKHFSYFYKMTVDEIEPINVQNWQLELAKEFSPNYIRIVQGMLSIAFDRAVVLGLAKKNPSRMIGNIKSKKTKVDFWTLDEFQKVISLLYKGDYYEHYLFISYWLLFMTGMRIGEAAALQWSDINFETGLLSITKTLYYKTMDEYKFVEPKTQASIRTIYIDTDTIKELKAWQEVQQKVLKGCDLVLSYNGIPTSKHTLPRALEKLAGLAGVHRIKIHALRHSHASLLISMGENPLLIKERLGHEKIQTTLGTYGHLYPNTNVESINIGSLADLERLEIGNCSRLRSIQIYSNPKLTSIEFGSHPETESLYCSYNGFSSLSLKSLSALRDIDLSSNEVLSHLELNEKTSISAILIQGCAFQSITDILKCCPSLRELSCSYNKLTELDLSDNSNINELRCEHNQLTRLMVPQGSLLEHLYCHSNQLDEDALNTLFDSLGQVLEPAIYYPTPPRLRCIGSAANSKSLFS